MPLGKYANRKKKETTEILKENNNQLAMPKLFGTACKEKKGHTDRKLNLMRAGSRSSFLFVAAMTTTRLSCSNPSIYKTYIFSIIQRCTVWN